MDYSKTKRGLRSFYSTTEWRKVRMNFIDQSDGLCERCKKKGFTTVGDTVHHKTYLTLDNVNDTNIAYNSKNLELLCHNCHELEHSRTSNGLPDGYYYTLDGEIEQEPWLKEKG